MRSYAQYCPIAKASEILGDRWTLLIVREMLGGATGFNELQRGLPGISRSVLTDRMRSLERAEIVACNSLKPEHLAHDQDCPAVAEDLACLRDRAVLGVTSHRATMLDGCLQQVRNPNPLVRNSNRLVRIPL